MASFGGGGFMKIESASAVGSTMSVERLHDLPLGLPSPEALRLARSIIRRRYVLPETMDHPQVTSQCLRLAYMIQAYGLGTSPRPTETDAGVTAGSVV
jgi:hypothetical protein